MDTARILGDIQHSDSVLRRFFILSTVKKELKEHLEKTKIDELLYKIISKARSTKARNSRSCSYHQAAFKLPGAPHESARAATPSGSEGLSANSATSDGEADDDVDAARRCLEDVIASAAFTTQAIETGETIFSWYSGEGEPRVAERWEGRVRRVGGAGALGGGAVNVSAVREADAGLYRCRVAFPNRSPPARNNGTFYYLDVDGGNLIATPPHNVTVLEGERAELQCQPKSPEWRVAWLRNGEPAREPAPNGSLLLPRAAAADLAEYECRVSAPDGRTQSASAWLDVQYAARVLHSPAERLLAHGKAASLDCHFSANPPLTNLRWEKDGFLFDPYNVPGVFYSRNGSLLFNRVDESHAGVYACTPYNALGSAGASGGVRVRVLRPPALAAAPQPLYLARVGGAVTLPCEARAPPDAPAPAVRWARADGRALPASALLRGGNLTLRALAPADRGVYECRVSNAAAELRVRSELLLENVPPRAPHDLRAAPAPGAAVQLSWAPGHSGADAEYAVWFRERDAPEWRSVRLPTRGATRATLPGLRAGAAYELRVLAQEPGGDGLLSRPVFVRAADADGEESATELPPEAEEAPATDGPLGALDSADDTGDDGDAAADTEDAAGDVDVADDADDVAQWNAADAAPVELDVSVRLIEEGALVRWRGAAGVCELRWYDDEAPERRLLLAASTPQQYALVGELREGARYWAQVRCAGARGAAALAVPQYARLRGVALGAGGGALLLAALAGALCAARRRR
ncbi:protein borderless-like [Pararge aegeria]|uniref:protein borderless-like n=1 Tax=Pararge aegeria TaxID=116150 RepID=UPI0019D244FC|nr:protein borderless-like [Pararge aegeria]